MFHQRLATDYIIFSADAAFEQTLGSNCVGEKTIRVALGSSGAACTFKMYRTGTEYFGLITDNFNGQGSLQICSPLAVLQYVSESMRDRLMVGWHASECETCVVSVDDITSVDPDLFGVVTFPPSTTPASEFLSALLASAAAQAQLRVERAERALQAEVEAEIEAEEAEEAEETKAGVTREAEIQIR